MPRLFCTRLHPAEQLEVRILPTVKVNFNPNNGILKITGDNDGNRIDIQGIELGKVEVFVNAVLFDTFEGVSSIKANLKGGDDQFLMSSVQIEKDLSVKTGSGADHFDMDDIVDLGSGMDNNCLIGLKTKVDLGGDVDDQIECDDAIAFGDDVVFTGAADVDLDGDGVSANLEGDDIIFSGNLTINLSGGGDGNGDNLELDFDNVVVFGATSINGSNGVDRIQVKRSAFGQDFKLNLEDGNDVVRLNNGAANLNQFDQAVILNGGDDNDVLLLGTDNLFNDDPTVVNFETVV